MKVKVECNFLVVRHPVIDTLQKIEVFVKKNSLVFVPKRKEKYGPQEEISQKLTLFSGAALI